MDSGALLACEYQQARLNGDWRTANRAAERAMIEYQGAMGILVRQCASPRNQYHVLMQEARLGLLRALKTYSPAGSGSRRVRFGTWASTCIKCELRHAVAPNRYSWQRNEMQWPDESEDAGEAEQAKLRAVERAAGYAPDVAGAVHRKILIERLLAQLTSRQLDAVRIRFEGADIEQAAQERGIPVTTVHTRAMNALWKLKRYCRRNDLRRGDF